MSDRRHLTTPYVPYVFRVTPARNQDWAGAIHLAWLTLNITCPCDCPPFMRQMSRDVFSNS